MTKPVLLRALLLAGALALAACASKGPSEERSVDPLRPVNRPLFAFNEGFDRFAFGPVARGWKLITTRKIRTGFRNFFENTASPSRFVSSLGQGELRAAGIVLGRFVMNTTAGIAGFVDIASLAGVPRYVEDTGKMFARWGIPPGPFLMVPIVGPSSPRDGIGLAADAVMNPMFWLAPIGSVSIFALNERAIGNDQIDLARRTAIDYYAFTRSAYVQYRATVVNHRGPADFRTQGFEFLDQAPIDDDLYELDLED
jgi:phospholipid-binding lipoprotein MlaA